MTTVAEFATGQRIELCAQLRASMPSERYGVVEKVGNTLITVRLERSGRVRHFDPRSLLHIT